MLDEQIDYTGCTLAELRDIAAHIDRERFAERAAVVDREIRRRNALPMDLQEAVSFEGGLRVGSFLYFGRTIPHPLGSVLEGERVSRGDAEGAESHRGAYD